jgi:cell division septation protein DedD
VDDLVKERLTGAIILVALIVLLVPELLTGPVRPTSRMAGAAQPAEGSPLRSYTINLDEEVRAAPADSPAPSAPVAPAAEPLARQAAPTQAQTGLPAAATPTAPSTPTAPRAASVPPPSVPAAPQATPVTVTNSAGKGWMVQLGSFVNRPNAERLAQQLSGRGFQVSIVRGTTGRRLYRVLVGPTRDRAGALRLAARLRAAGHSGSVVPR